LERENGHIYEIDSRAQRKIETGDSLVLMVENSSAADAFLVAIQMRFLFKLH